MYVCYSISYRSAGEAAEHEVHQELLGRAVRHDARDLYADKVSERPRESLR